LLRRHTVSEEADMSLPGKRVLITEDEFFLALWLGQVLEEQGYAVVGPATSVEEAFQLIEKAKPNAAILDINLNGEMVYPAAKELMDRGIPFVFATGYSTLDVPTTFRSIPRLEKPVSPEILVGALNEVFRKAHPDALLH
jgi:DNA-binding response OmpR family regulator